MHSAALFTLFSFAVFCAAAPKPEVINPDQVLVIKPDGSYEVLDSSEYDSGLSPAPPVEQEFHTRRSVRHDKRGCEESTEVQVLKDESFLNWDVPMSPVLNNVGGEGASARVTVGNGYSLSNTLSVSVESSLSIKDVLGLSLGVSYSETWTTTQDQSFSFTIPNGQYGIIVSQPKVRRRQGKVLSGCTDSWDEAEFTSDDYKSQSFGKLEWVEGVIRLCNSTQYPVPFCIGDGTHS